ncbi:GAK system CofD-like protein [Flexibacterium corallicola]|uniref:GAK system CofD-like protein n=1 Tax=Flexibacterium corallicola TaxID=3037259 RepID=UPI00286EB5F1|nr:GAK system CofD-like protein [Pseudovibrio sp. M1P-2-3]
MAPRIISRRLTIPDPIRVERARRLPELGPKILFFSGGTALNDISRCLKNYSHNTCHLITPFDSGGSSAALRKAFNMPAIGDLRSRLIALADETATGHPEIARLFSHRLAKDKTHEQLKCTLEKLVSGQGRLLEAVHEPMRGLIRTQLEVFLKAMPLDFDLRGASIGNLILAGGYLNNSQNLDPIIFLFSKLINTLGVVTAITDSNCHLAAMLEDGTQIIGQHRMTGKEVPALQSRITETFAVRSLDDDTPVPINIAHKMSLFIHDADLICYPPGSFHSSLMANLLPSGVGRAITQNPNPKVYIPNLGNDPEQFGMTPTQSVMALLERLNRDLDQPCETSNLLNYIITDAGNAGDFDKGFLKEHSIELISSDLLGRRCLPYYDPKKLVELLLSLT